jgi:hypothetical protein
MVAALFASHDSSRMSIFQIASLIVLTVWLVESIVFIAGYQRSLES